MLRRLGTLLCAVLLVACRDARIANYQVPHEEPPNPTLTAEGETDMANTAVPTATGDNLTWTAPDHWESRPAGTMRQATYAIVGPGGAEADLSITAFPGDVGGLLANVNRWRDQLGLAALSQAQLATQTEHLDVGELHLTYVDYAGGTGSEGTRLLGAIVPLANETWFFKLSGPDSLVGPERDAFRAFLGTLQPAP